MIPLSEVLVFVQTQWDASVALGTLVPGGLWHARVNEDTAAPYATVTAVCDGVQMTAVNDYIANVSVTLTVWGTVQLGSATVNNIYAAVNNALAPLSTPTSLTACKLMGLYPDSGTVQLDDNQRDAADVIQLQTVYRGMLQARAGS
jgi:hypothetical protein